VDKQLFVDRLLEAENLTDNLEDNDANKLLGWGLAQVDGLIHGAADEDAASEKITSLMSVMRTLNSLAGDPGHVTREAIADLLTQHGQTFEHLAQVNESEYRSVAERVSKMVPGEAVSYLIDWLDKKQS